MSPRGAMKRQRTVPAPPSAALLEDAALSLTPNAPILRSVIGLIEAPTRNLAGVGPLVASSPILTLNVLREANRSQWPEKTASLAVAVGRLGAEGMRELCERLASTGEPAPSLGHITRANQIARAASDLAKLRFAYDAQHTAHVAGLLYAAGAIVAERHGEDIAVVGLGARGPLGISHAEISERLARLWFFPHELADALVCAGDLQVPDDGLARALWLAVRLVDAPEEAYDAARVCGFSSEQAQMLCLQHAIGPTPVPLFAELQRPCPLTERQLDYLRLLAAGESREAIASRFGRARSTIDNVLCLAYRGLGVNGEYRALMMCKEQGWI